MIALQRASSIEVYNSVGGSAFFERLVKEWRDDGAEVTHYHALSEAQYREQRGSLRRIGLRWRMYGGYAWQCWRGARGGRTRAPIRVVTTNPFFAPSLVVQGAKGSGPTINLLYDLFPEALIQAGTVSRDSWLARRCASVTRHALRSCAATVFLGDRLRLYAEKTYGSAQRAAVIPVGADGLPFENSPPQLLAPGTRPQILYSGQMGRMHDTSTLAAVWQDGRSNGVTWVLHASGSAYGRLRKLSSAQPDVIWGGALTEADWQRAMKQAQVALVTIAAGAECVVMPSKTYSALVAGQAVLAICSRVSDLADLIERHDCGWVVEPGDVAGLIQVLDCIVQRPNELWAKRRNAFEAGHRFYDMKPVAKEWFELFQALANEAPVRSVGERRT